MSDKISTKSIKTLIKIMRESKVEYLKVNSVELKLHALALIEEPKATTNHVSERDKASIDQPNVQTEDDLYWSVE